MLKFGRNVVISDKLYRPKCSKLDGHVRKCIEVTGNRHESLSMDGGVRKTDVSVL